MQLLKKKGDSEDHGPVGKDQNSRSVTGGKSGLFERIVRIRLEVSQLGRAKARNQRRGYVIQRK
jgi:hypothetical protein